MFPGDYPQLPFRLRCCPWSAALTVVSSADRAFVQRGRAGRGRRGPRFPCKLGKCLGSRAEPGTALGRRLRSHLQQHDPGQARWRVGIKQYVRVTEFQSDSARDKSLSVKVLENRGGQCHSTTNPLQSPHSLFWLGPRRCEDSGILFWADTACFFVLFFNCFWEWRSLSLLLLNYYYKKWFFPPDVFSICSINSVKSDANSGSRVLPPDCSGPNNRREWGLRMAPSVRWEQTEREEANTDITLMFPVFLNDKD